jgi:SAM-dependent methyltransferase
MDRIRTDGLDVEDRQLEQRLELMRGPIGAWRVDREVQARALERLRLKPEHRLVEIGCGPLQAGAPLIRFLEPGHYTGVDISAERLAAARELVQRFGLEEREPRLVRSDDFGLDQLAPGTFDRLWSFHVVIHFPQPLIARFMHAVATLLNPGGIGWFSAWVAGDGAPFTRLGSWLEFPVTEAGSDFFKAAAADAGLDCVGLGTLKQWGLPSDRPAAENWLFQVSRPGVRRA